jgi:hypothetical protein
MPPRPFSNIKQDTCIWDQHDIYFPKARASWKPKLSPLSELFNMASDTSLMRKDFKAKLAHRFLTISYCPTTLFSLFIFIPRRINSWFIDEIPCLQSRSLAKKTLLVPHLENMVPLYLCSSFCLKRIGFSLGHTVSSFLLIQWCFKLENISLLPLRPSHALQVVLMTRKQHEKICRW